MFREFESHHFRQIFSHLFCFDLSCKVGIQEMLFNSTIAVNGSFNANFSQDIIKNEPMLFNCDREAASTLGGPITRAFLDNLPGDWSKSEVVIDSRVHMLMPGWYPAIPGFHGDDVPRNNDQFGQPNYTNPEYNSTHLMGLVNGEICPTEFALGSIELELPPPEEIIYKHWHPQIDAACEPGGTMVRYSAQSGQYIQFDANSFHQATPAKAAGWRWFIRVSRDTTRTSRCTNELRRQVQVYLENPMQGW